MKIEEINIEDIGEEKLNNFVKNPHFHSEVIAINLDAVEDQYILLEINGKYVIAKDCLSVYGWHHTWTFNNKKDAIQLFNELIKSDKEIAKEYYEIKHDNLIDFEYNIYISPKFNVKIPAEDC